MKQLALALAVVALSTLPAAAQVLRTPANVRVVDALDQEVGRIQSITRFRVRLVFEVDGHLFMLNLNALNEFEGDIDNIAFTGPDCTGDAFHLSRPLEVVPVAALIGPNKRVFVADPNGVESPPSPPLEFQSSVSGEQCVNGLTSFGAAFPMLELIALGPLFTPPFSVQPGTLQQQVEDLEDQVGALSGDLTDHTHTYLTGPGPGQNAVQATTGSAIIPAAP